MFPVACFLHKNKELYICNVEINGRNTRNNLDFHVTTTILFAKKAVITRGKEFSVGYVLA
jgi:hypothetical protein